MTQSQYQTDRIRLSNNGPLDEYKQETVGLEYLLRRISYMKETWNITNQFTKVSEVRKKYYNEKDLYFWTSIRKDRFLPFVMMMVKSPPRTS